MSGNSKKYRENRLLSIKQKREQEKNEYHNETEDDISIELSNYESFDDEDNFTSSLDNQYTDYASPVHCDTNFFSL